MKKLMTVFLAAALVFAVASQASATALETSGEFRARYWYLNNYFTSGKSTEFWDSRLRLNLVWPVAEAVKVTVRADVLEGFWGDQILDSKTTPASGDTPAVTTYVANANNRPQITFDHVNLMFTWPGTPLTFTLGRQDASWGPGFFTKSDNRDRFKLTAKFGDTTVLYTYDKYIDIIGLHDTASLDDRRQHSVGAITKLAGFNLGLIYGLILNNTDPNADWSLNAVDVYGMGKIGPVDLKAEVAFAVGKNDKTVGEDEDLSGLLAYLGVAIPAGPVTIGVEGAYAKGNDLGTSDKNEGALKSEYQSPFWSVILFNNMEYDGFRGESNFTGDSGLSNAMAGKLSVAVVPVKGLTLMGAAVYATRDQVASGKDKPMGIEFDLVVSYNITENVNWTLGGGYLLAGDYYGDDVDDPMGAKSAFTVKF